MGADEAAELALSALTFLAEDGPRLGRFLALTGLTPADLAQNAATAELQAAVLDHLVRDETLLLVFAASRRIPAESVAAAHLLLAGRAPGPGEDWGS